MGGAAPFDVPSLLMRNFFGIVSTLLLFITPMLTMGVYAEERRRGTMELLMTSPITDVAIVLGKFLASLTLLVIMLRAHRCLVRLHDAHSEPAASWTFAVQRLSWCAAARRQLLALGSFFSSLTESQLIAGDADVSAGFCCCG